MQMVSPIMQIRIRNIGMKLAYWHYIHEIVNFYMKGSIDEVNAHNI